MKVEEVLGGVRDAMNVKRVFGEPYERDGVTVIPVASVSGGGGGGGDVAGNGGSGFGLSGRAIGAYVVKDGTVRWEPAIDVTRLAIVGQIFAIAALLVWRSVVKTRAKARIKAAKR